MLIDIAVNKYFLNFSFKVLKKDEEATIDFIEIENDNKYHIEAI